MGDDDASFARRLDAQMAIFGERADDGKAWLDARRDRWILGTPDAARERIAAYRGAGIDRLLYQVFLPRDPDHIVLLGELARSSG